MQEKNSTEEEVAADQVQKRTVASGNLEELQRNAPRQKSTKHASNEFEYRRNLEKSNEDGNQSEDSANNEEYQPREKIRRSVSFGEDLNNNDRISDESATIHNQPETYFYNDAFAAEAQAKKTEYIKNEMRKLEREIRTFRMRASDLRKMKKEFQKVNSMVSFLEWKERFILCCKNCDDIDEILVAGYKPSI